jgi:serine/threonine protein kinase
LVSQLTDALVHAHEEGVVHRDLKPANMMLVNHRGRDLLKVIDFGIAKIVAADHHSRGLTHQGDVVGTSWYMAPEQIAGRVDPRSDLYSVGCILYELLVGEPPFDGRPMEIISAHLNRKPEPPSYLQSGISPEVDDLVMRCLEKDPDWRFANAQELLDAIRSIREYRSESEPTWGASKLNIQIPSSADLTPPREKPRPQRDTARNAERSTDIIRSRQKYFAKLREIVELLLDRGQSDLRLVIGLDNLKQLANSVANLEEEVQITEKRRAQFDSGLRERQKSMRFMLGELRNDERIAEDSPPQSRNTPVHELRRQIRELEDRLREVMIERDSGQVEFEERLEAFAAHRAVLEDEQQKLCASLARVVEEKVTAGRMASTVDQELVRLHAELRDLTK